MRVASLLAAGLVLLSGCVGGLTGSDSSVSEASLDGNGDGQAPVFSEPVVVDDERDMVEPAVRVDSQGRVYVAALPSVAGNLREGRTDAAGASQVFRSLDGGRSFEHLDPLPTSLYGASFGGGDVDVALGPADQVYVTDLWSGNVGFVASEDHGDSWPTSTPATFKTPAVDRQWIDVHQDTGTIYVTTQSLSVGAAMELAGTNSNIVLTESTDGGETFAPERLVETEKRNCICPTGPLVVNEPRDELALAYWVLSDSDEIGVSYSEDGGQTWGHTTVPGIDERPSVFAALAHDEAGNLYLATTDDDRVVLSTSADGGRTWTTPMVVGSDPGDSQIIPWVVAGASGQAAVAWREATTVDGEQRWDFELATVRGALSGSPSVHVERLNQVPIDRGNHSLREVNELALGPDGAIHASWPEFPEDGGPVRTMYARQVGGVGLDGTTVDGFTPQP